MIFRNSPLVLTCLLSILITGCATHPHPASSDLEPVEIGIIAINDFHGNLEPPGSAVEMPGPDGKTLRIPAGGAAWLASAIDELRSKYRHHLTVSAGDLTSASQLASSLFLDEPTIGVMNRIGLDFNAVGNHEFDRGWHELERLQNGGCEQFAVRKPCAVEAQFKGAQFDYLAANVRLEDGTTLFPGSALRQFGESPERVAVGLIGLTLKGTPALVTPEGIAGLTFGDEADAINSATHMLKQNGADAIVVLIHQGISTGGLPDPNSCENAEGALLPILERLDSQVDVVISGHTHGAYVCDWQSADGSRNLLLTSAGNYGMLATDISLLIDPASGSVIDREALNVPVQSTPFRDVEQTTVVQAFSPRPDIADYVAHYVAAAEAFSSRPAGKLAHRAVEEDAGGGPLGNLIADAQLAATATAGAQIAFMNPFGIRSDIEPQADGTVTFDSLYRTQPFDNTLVTMTLTGAQLKTLLESQVDDMGPVQILAVSEGFTFSWDMSQPEGQRIAGIQLHGESISPTTSYRITVNSFLASGGDGFTILNEGTDRVLGMSDLEALEAWLQADPPRRAPETTRVSDRTPQ